MNGARRFFVGALSVAVLLALDAGPAGAALVNACAGPVVAEASAYYAIDLVSTARVPGTRGAGGTATVRFARSPFGVSLAADGQYAQEIEIRTRDLPVPRTGRYVAWVTPPTLTPVMRIGEVVPGEVLRAVAEWNKYLVVITLEQEAAEAPTWEGTIVLRGISRSGRMHTMAGHGAFEAEPCAKYGY